MLVTRKKQPLLVRVFASLAAVAVLGGCGAERGGRTVDQIAPDPETAARLKAEEETRKTEEIRAAIEKNQQEIKRRQEDREKLLDKRCHAGGTILLEYRNEQEQNFIKQGELLYEGTMACLKHKGTYIPYFVIFFEPLTEQEFANGKLNEQPLFGVGYTIEAARKARDAAKARWKAEQVRQRKASQGANNKDDPKPSRDQKYINKPDLNSPSNK